MTTNRDLFTSAIATFIITVGAVACLATVLCAVLGALEYDRTKPATCAVWGPEETVYSPLYAPGSVGGVETIPRWDLERFCVAYADGGR